VKSPEQTIRFGFRSVWRREARIILRDRSSFLQLVLFGISVALLGALALKGAGVQGTAASLGLFWVAFLFNQVLQLESIYRTDIQSGVWRRFRLHRALFGWYFGKIIGQTLLAILIAVVLLGASLLFASAQFKSTLLAIPFLAGLVGLGFIGLGVLLLPIAQASGQRSTFLPLLLFPLGFPLLLSGMEASQILAGQVVGDLVFWIAWIVLLDAVYLGIASMILEEVLIDG
jgi:ABC-type transport system involved in cytochrome c biogenesis permease component